MAILAILPAPVWLCLSALWFAAGEFFSKKWAIQPSMGGLMLVIGCYALSSLLWLPALFHKNQLAIMGTTWLLLATVATLVIGYSVFGESISTRQFVGVSASLVAFVLLSA